MGLISAFQLFSFSAFAVLHPQPIVNASGQPYLYVTPAQLTAWLGNTNALTAAQSARLNAGVTNYGTGYTLGGTFTGTFNGQTNISAHIADGGSATWDTNTLTLTISPGTTLTWDTNSLVLTATF